MFSVCIQSAWNWNLYQFEKFKFTATHPIFFETEEMKMVKNETQVS